MKMTGFVVPGLLAATLILTPLQAVAQQSSEAGAAVPAARSFSQQELDRLLAPIALYPDPLLAQILMASTYPLEVVQAARWVKANPKVTGKSLEEAMTQQKWDPAVKSMTAVPQVLQQMNEKLEWTQKLGDVFLAQSQDVMNTVQSLRAKAYAAGNLKTSDQLVVKSETQGNQVIYIVQPAKVEIVHVPIYNPGLVYGTWWYSYPPYYMYPPAYVYPAGVAFASGVVVGAAIWGYCHWGNGHSNVSVNISHYNSFNRTSISNTSVSRSDWTHNPQHRGSVAYPNDSVAQQFSRNKPATGNLRAKADPEGKAMSGRDQEMRQAPREPQKGNLHDNLADTPVNERAPGGLAGESADRGLPDFANNASLREAGPSAGGNRAERGNFGGNAPRPGNRRQ